MRPLAGFLCGAAHPPAGALVALGALVLLSGCAVLAPTETPAPAARTVIRAADGTTLAVLFEENRRPIAADRIPRLVKDALVAAEDGSFYQHDGLDGRALLRALAVTVTTGEPQGGSTITQQVAKMTYHRDEPRTIDAKIRETMLAFHLEDRYTKDELLAMYLNRAYFGAGAYGIAAAAETFFGIPVEQLSLPQAALLVGSVVAPTALDPARNPEGALRRRAYVLRRMTEEGMITHEQRDRALRAPLGLRRAREIPERASAFVGWVQQQLLADPALGDTPAERAHTMRTGGLEVITTLDARMQRAAERAVQQTLDRPEDPEVTLVAIDPHTGAVKAMVGGRDHRPGDLNLAVHGRRQPGSTFKPLALAAAVEQGIAPWTRYDSAPATLRWGPDGRARWRVSNYDGRNHGRLSLSQATRRSVNGVYARLVLDIGPQAVVDVARRLGITAAMDPYPSIVLGALRDGVSTLELASAYGAFAAYGRLAEAHAITAVSDGRHALVARTPQQALPVLDPGIAHLVNEELQGVIERGTGRTAWLGRPAAGKTGTTEGYADAWFVGYTPDLVAAVWVGYPDQRRPMRNVRGRAVTGSSFPAAIWRAFMQDALAGTEQAAFEPPPHALVQVRVGPAGDCVAAHGGRLVELPPVLLPGRPCPVPSPSPSDPSAVDDDDQDHAARAAA